MVFQHSTNISESGLLGSTLGCTKVCTKYRKHWHYFSSLTSICVCFSLFWPQKFTNLWGCTTYITIFYFALGVFGNAPTMLWTECTNSEACEKCLTVSFETENDVACLNKKWPKNDCLYSGYFDKVQNTRVVVSSEQCQIDPGNMENIQVLHFKHSQSFLRF